MGFFRPQNASKDDRGVALNTCRRGPERVGNNMSIWFSLVHSDPNKENLWILAPH